MMNRFENLSIRKKLMSVITSLALVTLASIYLMEFMVAPYVVQAEGQLSLIRVAIHIAMLMSFSAFLVLWLQKTIIDPIDNLADASAVAVEKYQEEARIAREDAQHANRIKSDFLATMSHEIRTPMNGVLGTTELLFDTDLTQQQKKYVQTVMYSAEALLDIINDILDFSEIEIGNLTLKPVPLDLLKVIDDMAERMAPKAQEKGVELIVHFAPETAQYLIGDPDRICQAVANLVSNAIKFTEKGHVLISVEEEANAFLNAGQRQLKISVTDTGIGIPKDVQDGLFQKFTQADSSATRRYGGTGIGLAICKSLSEMMNGHVGLKSDEGVGSTFWFSMMLEEDSHKDFITLPPANLQNVKILVVDDVWINGEFLCDHFSRLSMHCEMSADGDDALEKLRHAADKGAPFNIVVIDYLMPDMDGEELAQAIKSDDKIKDMALILLASAKMKSHVSHFSKVGFSAFMPKPVRMQDLTNIVAQVWEKYASGDRDSFISSVDLPSHENKEFTNFGEIKFKDTHVLLVEDNRINCMMAEEMLQDMGVLVDVAENGKICLNAVTKKKYDLILMDVQMPIMDGLEATRQIRSLIAEGSLGDVIIVALTANVMKGDRKECLDAGMNDYISKPVCKEMLKTSLAKWLPHKTSDGSVDDKETVPASVILNEETLGNYCDIMQDKFMYGIDVFLHETWLLFGNISESWKKNDIKAVHHATHSLKSSTAMFGAMQLFSLCEDLEEETYNIMEQGRTLEDMDDAIIDDMVQAFKRFEPLLNLYIQNTEKMKMTG